MEHCKNCTKKSAPACKYEPEQATPSPNGESLLHSSEAVQVTDTSRRRKGGPNTTSGNYAFVQKNSPVGTKNKTCTQQERGRRIKDHNKKTPTMRRENGSTATRN